MADTDMVRVHVDDGTKRGHDRKFTRKDAEKFLAYTPNAKIVEDVSTADAAIPDDEMPGESEVPAARRSRSAARSEAPATEDPPADDTNDAKKGDEGK